MRKEPFQILLVEDNPSDVELVREALSAWTSATNLVVAEDGEQAVRYLRRNASYAEEPAPDLILLDLNLPKKDGAEVLQDIKNDENLRSIPVIVLTTSDREQDVRRAYSLHANCYLTKPLEIDEFVDKVKAIEDFWLTYARLPHKRIA